MSNYRIKGLPPIKLSSLLKKKRISLKSFLSDMGIEAYQTLLIKCKKMGVVPPEEKDFLEATGGIVHSSPQEGLIVLEPPVLVKDSGQKVEVDDFCLPAEASQEEPLREETQEEPVIFSTKKKKK